MKTIHSNIRLTTYNGKYTPSVSIQITDTELGWPSSSESITRCSFHFSCASVQFSTTYNLGLRQEILSLIGKVITRDWDMKSLPHESPSLPGLNKASMMFGLCSVQCPLLLMGAVIKENRPMMSQILPIVCKITGNNALSATMGN